MLYLFKKDRKMKIKSLKCLENVSVISGNDFQAFQQVFFPLSQNAETVSQPVKAN